MDDTTRNNPNESEAGAQGAGEQEDEVSGYSLMPGYSILPPQTDTDPVFTDPPVYGEKQHLPHLDTDPGLTPYPPPAPEPN